MGCICRKYATLTIRTIYIYIYIYINNDPNYSGPYTLHCTDGALDFELSAVERKRERERDKEREREREREREKERERERETVSVVQASLLRTVNIPSHEGHGGAAAKP